jgi:hypothetical protein
MADDEYPVGEILPNEAKDECIASDPGKRPE